MIKFSANLGFLWTELPLPDAIRAAKAAGFDAVECHWPYAVDATDVVAALAETNLKMLGLNTQRGDVANGDNGCAAIPGRETEARGYIDEAISYAKEIGCKNIHVMAGKTDQGAEAVAVFRENLVYACKQAKQQDMTILIEPLNTGDAPGYHLTTLDQAQEILADVREPNLKIMFDCYHLEIMQGGLVDLFKRAISDIGHVQIAGVPTRGEPDQGHVNFPVILATFVELGWQSPIGAEYKPTGTTQDSLGWMKAYK